MNIDQLYQQKANVSLNASLVALIPAIVLVLIGPFVIKHNNVVLLTTPFLLYSFSSYQVHLLFKTRAQQISDHLPPHLTEIGDASHVALAFLPAPSLTLQMYTEDGQLMGVLQDAKTSKWRWFVPRVLDKHLAREYHFVNPHNQSLVTFSQLNRKTWQVNAIDKRPLATITTPSPNRYLLNVQGNPIEVEQNSASLFMDTKWMDTEGEVLARVRRGWLPLPFRPYREDPNVPILSFSPHLDVDQKYALFMLIILAFRYIDH